MKTRMKILAQVSGNAMKCAEAQLEQAAIYDEAPSFDLDDALRNLSMGEIIGVNGLCEDRHPRLSAACRRVFVSMLQAFGVVAS